ncbi:hypothetical protein INT43_000433 [Umbelopsis isabellina]|uniref:Uncharacterized protein n=1 Tax=Mortierella isabellina TaxID=91625 RepID=A0A8H7UMR7_MORIS|nr:hypothetical protein INT43_000433 [Umbelopsis isabellina]
MSIVISSTSIKRRNGSFSGQVTNISGQEAYISRRGKTGSRRDTMGSISGRDTSTSTPDTTDTTSDQEQPCTHNHRLRRPSSFQRLSQNTASSSARMKTLRSVGVDSNGPAGLLMKRRPKAEMTSVIQHDLPYDSLGKFENQTELKAQDFDGTKSESYRSICMACTRQVACKPSLDGFEQSTQLRPSTPSSPIPTQHAPVIHSAEAHGQDWQGQFFALTTMLIRHSDQLQRLSLDLLKSDTKVKEVLLTGYDLADNYATQERKYENELLYYNNALKRQQALIDTLETLIQDVCTTPVAPGAHIPARHEENIAVPTSSCGITQVQGSFVTRIRWQISQLIGGCVGTGHVVNASCSNEEILILSGTGVLLEQVFALKNVSV